MTPEERNEKLKDLFRSNAEQQRVKDEEDRVKSAKIFNEAGRRQRSDYWSANDALSNGRSKDLAQEQMGLAQDAIKHHSKQATVELPTQQNGDVSIDELIETQKLKHPVLVHLVYHTLIGRMSKNMLVSNALQLMDDCLDSMIIAQEPKSPNHQQTDEQPEEANNDSLSTHQHAVEQPNGGTNDSLATRLPIVEQPVEQARDILSSNQAISPQPQGSTAPQQSAPQPNTPVSHLLPQVPANGSSYRKNDTSTLQYTFKIGDKIYKDQVLETDPLTRPSTDLNRNYPAPFSGSGEELSRIYIVVMDRCQVGDPHATLQLAQQTMGQVKRNQPDAYVEIIVRILRGGNVEVIPHLQEKASKEAKNILEKGFFYKLPKPKEQIAEEVPEHWADDYDEDILNFQPVDSQKKKKRAAKRKRAVIDQYSDTEEGNAKKVPRAKRGKKTVDGNVDKPARKRPSRRKANDIPANYKALLESTGNGLEGKTCVLCSAVAHLGRQGAENVIKRHGGRLTKAISGKTDYAIVGTKTGKALLDQIRAFETKTLTVEEFVAMCEAGNVVPDGALAAAEDDNEDGEGQGEVEGEGEKDDNDDDEPVAAIAPTSKRARRAKASVKEAKKPAAATKKRPARAASAATRSKAVVISDSEDVDENEEAGDNDDDEGDWEESPTKRSKRG